MCPNYLCNHGLGIPLLSHVEPGFVKEGQYVAPGGIRAEPCRRLSCVAFRMMDTREGDVGSVLALGSDHVEG